MRHPKRSFTLAIVGISLISGLTACSSLKVSHEYDRDKSFNSFKSFQILPSKSISDAGINRLVKLMISTELVGKGLVEVEQHPDLLVTYDGWLQSHEQMATGLGYAVETYAGETTVYTISRGVPMGVLVVNLIERSSGTIVWKAEAEAALKPDDDPTKRLERLEGVITKFFEPYPARR